MEPISDVGISYCILHLNIIIVHFKFSLQLCIRMCVINNNNLNDFLRRYADYKIIFNVLGMLIAMAFSSKVVQYLI